MNSNKFTLILNSSNVSISSKNSYTYNFLKGNFTVPVGSEIMVSSIQLPYSFYNITSKYNNNKFTFQFPGTIAPSVLNVILPDGFYTTDDINAFLQQFCIGNGLYLINAAGKNVYYFNISYNVSYYSNQLLLLTVPTSLPSGWTQPPNWNGYNSVSQCPKIIILDNKFGDVLGFTPGSYPIFNTSNSSFLSNKTPKGSVVNSIVARCSLVNNYVTNPSDILDGFTIGDVSFGSNINFMNQLEKWVNISPGSYSSFNITFVDQDLNEINILDSNVLITLLLKFPQYK